MDWTHTSKSLRQALEENLAGPLSEAIALEFQGTVLDYNLASNTLVEALEQLPMDSAMVEAIVQALPKANLAQNYGKALIRAAKSNESIRVRELLGKEVDDHARWAALLAAAQAGAEATAHLLAPTFDLSSGMKEMVRDRANPDDLVSLLDPLSPHVPLTTCFTWIEAWPSGHWEQARSRVRHDTVASIGASATKSRARS